VTELPVGDLPRSSTDGRIDDEDVGVTLLRRAGAVSRPRQPIDDHGAARPFSASRPFRQLNGEYRIFIRNEHREGEPRAVRRPSKVARTTFEVGQLRDFPCVGPHDMDLRVPGAIGKERDATSVGRPHGCAVAPAPARQFAGALSFDVDDPEVAA
jgi:hypothetical protein